MKLLILVMAILIQGSKSKKSRKSGQARKSEIGTGTISTRNRDRHDFHYTHILSVNRACPDFRQNSESEETENAGGKDISRGRANPFPQRLITQV